MDLNRVVNMMRYKGLTFQTQQNFKIDKRFLSDMDVDIRVVLCWDADGVDVELQCLEWNNEKCHSFKNHSRNGGLLSRDFTGGYGTQEYLIRKAPEGKYTISARLFSPLISGNEVTAVCCVYTNFGRPNEIEKISVIKLSKPKEVVQICNIWIPGSNIE